MSIIKKHLTITKTAWQRALTYRFTVLAHRIGETGEMLILILMWAAIYSGGGVIKGYNYQEMITYILLGNLINAIVRNWLASVVSRDISNGTLSQFLVKPISYLRYILFREIGRISVAFFFSVISSLLVIFFFTRYFIINLNPLTLGLIAIMTILAFATELLLSFLIGLIAFWTTEVDGIYATIDRVKKFFSGGYFPISLLPPAFVKTSFLLPFGYSFFIPVQLYLGKIDSRTGLLGLLIQLTWIILLYGIIRVAWNRGIKKYEGVGI